MTSIDEDPVEVATPPRRCTNCEAETVDVYCARCGEKQPDHHDLSIGHFAHEVTHELVHLDSKLFRTLRELILRPGALTVEYFAGRKKRSIAPLRLYLTLFALQFLAYTIYKPVAVYSVDGILRSDSGDIMKKSFDRLAEKRNMPIEVFKERVDAKWQKYLSLLQLLNVAGMALVLKILYRRRYLTEHMVFSAHLLAFVYLFSVLIWPIYLVFGVDPGRNVWMTLLNMVLMLTYSYLALRRFYPQRRRSIAIKTVLLLGGMNLVALGVLSLALFGAIMAVR